MESKKTTRESVFNTIEDKININFWVQVFTIFSIVITILGGIWAFAERMGKNDTIDEQQTNTLNEHTQSINDLKNIENQQNIDIKVMEGKHR